MKINVGSKNETKVKAVTDALADYPLFKDAEVMGIEVPVKDFGHPKSLDEITFGATDRAKMAYHDCDYSFGIEGGLMAAPKTKTGFMEITVCAIFDGVNYHLGLSPAFEWPKAVIEGIIKKGLDGSQALKAAGLTSHEKIGTVQGGISLLTNGRIDRTYYNKLAVIMALIHLEHPEHY